jgi:hypothetical protein
MSNTANDRRRCVRWPLVSFGCTSGNTAWAAAKRSARGRSEFRTNPNMKSRGEILGSRAAAQTAAFRKTVFLFGVPRCRPPHRSPGLIEHDAGHARAERRQSEGIRRAVRVLAVIGELHKLRHWPLARSIGPATLFYRNHGAILLETGPPDDETDQTRAMIARYTSAAGNQYFNWVDAPTDTARRLADKFLARFSTLAECGRGWDYVYAGWYQRLLGYAERGWMPYVFSDDESISLKKLYLQDLRPADWRDMNERAPVLPSPPRGKLQQDYHGSGY